MLSQKDKEKLLDEMIRNDDCATLKDYICELRELEAELSRIGEKTKKIDHITSQMKKK